MNTEAMESQMKKNAAQAKQNIAQNKNDVLTQLEGKREEFAALAQEKYGIAKDKARAMVDEWMQRANTSTEELEKQLETYDRQIGETATKKLPDSVQQKMDRYPWLTLVVMMLIGLIVGRILSPSR